MRDKTVELFVVVGIFVLLFVGILVASWSYQTEIFLQNGMTCNILPPLLTNVYI
jgi:hypothetical protein